MQSLQVQGHGRLLESWELASEARPGRWLPTSWPAREPDPPLLKQAVGRAALGRLQGLKRNLAFP